MRGCDSALFLTSWGQGRTLVPPQLLAVTPATGNAVSRRRPGKSIGRAAFASAGERHEGDYTGARGAPRQGEGHFWEISHWQIVNRSL
jgi:hypothetical protein